MRVDERQDFVAEAALGGADRRTVALEPVRPEGKARPRHGERDFGGEAVARARRRHLRPGKEGEVGAWPALGVGIEEVVGAGIVLVDAFLDQLHAENPGVEIEILLRRSGNRRDVVQTVSTARCPLLRHDLSPS